MAIFRSPPNLGFLWGLKGRTTNISIDGDNLAQGTYMSMNTILVLLNYPQQLAILKGTEYFKGCLDKRIAHQVALQGSTVLLVLTGEMERCGVKTLDSSVATGNPLLKLNIILTFRYN